MTPPGSKIRTAGASTPTSTAWGGEVAVDSLRRRSVRGGAVTVVAQVFKLLLQVGATAVLARMLTPQDYGLIGLAASATGLVVLLRDLGLTTATVQREQLEPAQVNALFWINVAVSVVLAMAMAGIAPVMAWVFSEPALWPIITTLGAGLVFGGLSAQHTALLRRRMLFTRLAWAQVGSVLVGVAAGIAAAVMGAGYWALVVMQLVGAAMYAVWVWVGSGWRPGRPSVRAPGVDEMVRFGGNLTGFNLVNYFSRNADNLMLGWAWGTGVLGVYTRAYQLLLLPLRQLVSPASAVALPAMSRLQNDEKRYRQYYRRALTPLFAATLPLVVFTALAAGPIVQLFLGPAWGEVVPIFRWLAPASLVGSTYVATGWVYQSLGRTDRQLRWGLLAAVVTVAGFVVGVNWGAWGIAASYSVTSVLLRVPSVAYCFRGTFLKQTDFWLPLWRPSVAVLAAGLATVAAGPWLGLGLGEAQELPGNGAALLALLLSGPWFAVTYLAAWWALPGGRAELVGLFALRNDLRRTEIVSA